MRRDLAMLSLVTTAVVVLALLGPIALLVRQLERSQVTSALGEEANLAASMLAAAIAFDATPEAIESALSAEGDGAIVALPDGEIIGSSIPGQGSLISAAADTQSTVAGFVPAGYEVAVPIIAGDETTVIDLFAPNSDLTSETESVWLWMGGLSFALVAVAVWLSDRLGSRFVSPIDELADAAQRMSEGDLETRVTPRGPEEIQRLGTSFNSMTGKLNELMIAERESVADLSHGLRTPLAALRLTINGVTDHETQEALNQHADRLEREVDHIISAARKPVRRTEGECDINAVVEARARFWSALAREEDRAIEIDVAAEPVTVVLGRSSIDEAVDVLIENVFTHTPQGTGLRVSTGWNGELAWFEVSDRGQGFDAEIASLRGYSGSGSTGLGLDIVRRIAESGGGSLEIDGGPSGGSGATVRVVVGRAG